MEETAGPKKVLVITSAFHVREGRGVISGTPLELDETEAEALIALGYARRPKPLEFKRLKAEGVVDENHVEPQRGARNRYLRRDLRTKE